MPAIKAGKAAPGLIRYGLPKVFATGERHETFKLPHKNAQIVVSTQRTLGLPGRGLPDTRPGAKQSRWRSRYFCRTRAGLIACAREYAGPIGGDALVILLRLPERRGGRS